MPAYSRDKTRDYTVNKLLGETEVNTLPNIEPIGILSKSSFNYFLIIYNRYSRVYIIIVALEDKSTDIFIGGLEKLISKFSYLERILKSINHIKVDIGLELRSDTFGKQCGENNIQFNTVVPKRQEQNGIVKRQWGALMKLAKKLFIHA